MTINRTTLLDLPLPVTGTEAGTWGDVTNNGLTEYLDIAIAGMVSLTSSDFTAGALTISTTEGNSSGTNIANSSAQYATLKVSSLAANSTITAPASARAYRVINADATYTLTVKASGQTGVTFQPGTTGMVAFNGTDYEIVGVVGPASATDNAVARFDGTTGQIVQNSGVTIDDSNNVSGVAQLNATTADLTNIEVTNIKAKDGTAAGSIADSTGVVTLGSSVLTTTDINGGTIDNTTIGGATPAVGSFTQVNADNLRLDGNALTSTNSNGNIDLTPNGTGEVNISKVDIDSGAIDGTTIGGSSAAAITGTTITANTSVSTDVISEKTSAAGVTIDSVLLKDNTVTANAIYAQTISSISSFSWDSNTSTPAASSTNPYGGGAPVVTNIHRRMRRCLLADNGTVNYYLDPSDSAYKEDGTASVLTGADGMVMVEIPAFYVKRSVAGTVTTWSIADVPLAGFELHPAFIKDKKVVPFRYISAYDACYLDATDSTYKSGLNLDDLTSSLDLAADKLSSVSGVYPIVGVTRAECRTLASNRGTGWRQLDFALFSAVQLLYLIENQSFYSQNILGAGNTNGSYLSSSSNQNDSPHTVAGASNSLGNASTDTSSGAGVSAKPGTSFMSYRGIENFYGNCWNWADGILVNDISNGNVHVSNDSAEFSDSDSTGMQLITSSAPTTSNYVSAIAAIDNYFIATSVSGGSSSTYLTDYWYGSTSADRVVRVGGTAAGGADAGAFTVGASADASDSVRTFGARLAF